MAVWLAQAWIMCLIEPFQPSMASVYKDCNDTARDLPTDRLAKRFGMSALVFRRLWVMSGSAPRIWATGRATARGYLGCSASINRDPRLPSAWTIASSASSSTPTAARASAFSAGRSRTRRRSMRWRRGWRTQRINVARGARALADERHVKDLIVLNDPVGNRLEIFHGAETTAEPFKPGRSISGFRTGPLGLGHVVLNVDTAETIDRMIVVLLRHARFPIDGLLLLSLCGAFSSSQSASSQPGLRPKRQEHGPSRHDGAVQLR